MSDEPERETVPARQKAAAHGGDGWRDGVFIVLAVLLTACRLALDVQGGWASKASPSGRDGDQRTRRSRE